MKTSRNHLYFFGISGALLAIPGWLAAAAGCFLIIPVLLASIGTWLLLRTIKSTKADADSDYRQFTLLAHALFNGLCAIALMSFILKNSLKIVNPDNAAPYVLFLYSTLCAIIAFLGWQRERLF